ncbi:MAG TPA: hypothetical protein VM537_02450 [Anaerolineae bacterium]|nr:hypothetical protein [Anaerolineae bacterium]
MALTVWDFVFFLLVFLVGTVGGRWLINMFIPSAGDRGQIEARFKESERALAGAREHSIDTEKFRARLEIVRGQLDNFNGAAEQFTQLLYMPELSAVDIDTFHRFRLALGNAFVNIPTRLEEGPKSLRFASGFDAASKELGTYIRDRRRIDGPEFDIPEELLIPVGSTLQGMKQLSVWLTDKRICELDQPPDEWVMEHYLARMPDSSADTDA